MDALSLILDAFAPLSIIPRGGPRFAEENDAASKGPEQACVGQPANACLAGRRILDIGCGRGALAKALTARGLRVVGVDPNPEAVAAAAAAVPEAAFETASAQALPFADGAFDGAVFLNALHHVPDPGAALAEAARVVRPGGAVVVVEPLAEGSFFTALKPVEDETAVRRAAQEAIARAVEGGRFACKRDAVFERREHFESLDAFIERVVEVDPERREAAVARRDAVAAAFAAAGRDADGRHLLVQPLRGHVLVAAERG